MAITKYESIYSQIKQDLREIKDKFEYESLSKAFGYWYLSKRYDKNDDDINEILIDGYNDNGIDAYLINEENSTLTLFQFKFPENINKDISQDEILKFIEGCRIVIEGETNKPCSDEFKVMLSAIHDAKVFDFRLEIVSFSNGLSVHAKECLTDYKKEFEERTGSTMEVVDISKKDISNLFEKAQHKANLKINIPYSIGSPSYNVGNEVESFLCVINAKDFVNAIGDNIILINDENIRLYEGDTRINQGIKETASSNESELFYYYNNGITLICNLYNNDATARMLYTEGVSIVNGCQTVTSLYDLNKNGKLHDDVSILARIIKTPDYELRMKITEFLNSQNTIKDSYLLANHNSIRRLQNSLLDYGYYLNRQSNEYENKLRRNVDVPEDVIVLQLETVIQYYTAYFLDEYAALAKRNKGALFSRERSEEILKDISPEKVIESWQAYKQIASAITKFRKYRRNPDNYDFSTYFGISQETLEANILDYLFLNSSGLLLLNAFSLCRRNDNLKKLDDDEKIILSICVVRDIISCNHPEMAPASATKNTKVFEEVAVKISTLSEDNAKAIIGW